jgi:hypothetical protein
MRVSTNGRYWARTRLWGSGRARLPDFTGLRFPEISSGSVKLLPKLLPRLGEACRRPPRGYAVVNDIAPASQQLEFGLDSGRPTASTAPIRFHIAVSDLVRGFRRVASAWRSSAGNPRSRQQMVRSALRSAQQTTTLRVPGCYLIQTHTPDRE